MIYLGIDPSFSNTGACLLDTELKTIKFLAVKPPGTNDNYKSMINRSGHVAINIIRHLNMHKEVRTVMEEPLLTSQKASTLGVLSASLTWALAFIPSVKEMYSVHPSYVYSLMRPVAKQTGLGKKQTSKYAAELILEYFKLKKGYSIEIYNDKTTKDGSMKKRQLSPDEAEAFLILTTLLRLQGIINEELDMRFLGSISRKFFKATSLKQFKY